MKTRTAFLLRFLLPPFYAALGFASFTLLFESRKLADAAPLLGVFAFYAYIFAGLPAFLFAIAMARIERRCASENCLLNAALLGGLSGAVIGAVTGNFYVLAVLLLIGLVVGFLVEGTIVLLKRRAIRAT